MSRLLPEQLCAPSPNGKLTAFTLSRPGLLNDGQNVRKGERILHEAHPLGKMYQHCTSAECCGHLVVLVFWQNVHDTIPARLKFVQIMSMIWSSLDTVLISSSSCWKLLWEIIYILHKTSFGGGTMEHAHGMAVRVWWRVHCKGDAGFLFVGFTCSVL